MTWPCSLKIWMTCHVSINYSGKGRPKINQPPACLSLSLALSLSRSLSLSVRHTHTHTHTQTHTHTHTHTQTRARAPANSIFFDPVTNLLSVLYVSVKSFYRPSEIEEDGTKGFRIYHFSRLLVVLKRYCGSLRIKAAAEECRQIFASATRIWYSGCFWGNAQEMHCRLRPVWLHYTIHTTRCLWVSSSVWGRLKSKHIQVRALLHYTVTCSNLVHAICTSLYSLPSFL